MACLLLLLINLNIGLGMNIINEKVLVSWIGGNDLESKASKMTGPIWATVSDVTFDRLELIYNYPSDLVTPYLELLTGNLSCPVNARKADLSSPINFGEIYLAAERLLDIISRETIALSILLSPGTPAMQAVWILLGKTRFACNFYQASKEQGVNIVEIPFKLTAEYIPSMTNLAPTEFGQLGLLDSDADPAFDDIITLDPEMLLLKAKAQVLASHEVSVLICGESGTGKEMFARAIHNASARRDKPFVAVNCGAFPSELIDSILFGHKKGAFTGAVSDKVGVFELAHSGTLFLDEFGELNSSAQVRLLRVLQDGKFTRLGDSKERSSNFRLITATNRDLMADVSKGRFREDLFYRVAIGVLSLPPLRSRQSDLDHLADQFTAMLTQEYPSLGGKKISTAAKKIISNHRWPGNIRELKATILRAALWSETAVLEDVDIRRAILSTLQNSESILERDISKGVDIKSIIDLVERHYLERGLAFTSGNKRKTALLLGYNNHQTLNNRLKKLGLENDND